MPTRADNADMPEHRGSRPVPDPTELTTQQLIRENIWLRELLETRLDGMDKAIELLQATADKFPARMDEKIVAAIGVHDEKFKSIGLQFQERDVRTETSKRDGKDALDAALAAQKEAAEKQAATFGLSVAKSEAATDKRIDQMSALINTTADGLEGKISDVKDRLTRIEGHDEGATGTVSAQQAHGGYIVGIIGLVAAVVFGVGALILAFVKH